MDEYKTVLALKLMEIQGREMLTVREVQNILLDVWASLDATADIHPLEPVAV